MISRIFKAGALAFIAIAISYTAASAAESGKCGDNLTWTLDDEGTLTISGTGDMWDGKSSSGAQWSPYDRDFVKKVVLDNGVSSIGDYAFYGCSSLTSVSIPDSITSIGKGAFSVCGYTSYSSLTSITIPSGVTYISEQAFSRCKALTDIEVNVNNQYYCSEDGVLYNKSKNTLIRYPSSKLNKEYTIPDKVTSIGSDAFYGCSLLTSISIPDSVSFIGNDAFYGCNSLTSISIPDGVDSISDEAFLGCSSLTSISIPDSITSIGRSAFSGCSSLTSISISDSVTSIGEHAFVFCTSLTNINISDSVISIGDGAFFDCSGLTDIEVDPNNRVYSSENGVLFDKLRTTLIRYPSKRPDKNYIIPVNVSSIESRAFDNCLSLTSINIPITVTLIGGAAFDGCSSLTDVYYSGTEVGWNAIDKKDGNDPLTTATIHYGSEMPKFTPAPVSPAAALPTLTPVPQRETYVTQKAEEIAVRDSYAITAKEEAEATIRDANNVIALTDELMNMYESAGEDDRTASADAVNAKLKSIFDSIETIYNSDSAAVEGYEDILAQLRYDLDRLLLRVETEVPKMSVNVITPASGIHIVLRRFYNIYQIGCSVSASSGSASGSVDASIAEGVYTAEANISPETITLVPNADVVVEVRNGSKAVSGIFTVQDMVFTDVPPTHWANAAISELYGKGVVSGTGGGMFTPDAPVTREAFVKMSVTAFGDAYSDGVSGFADDGNSWYSPYIKSAADTGLVTGYADGRFGVGESITRQDIAVILWRRLGQPEAAASSFADNDEIADYAKTAVAYLASQGIINGYEDGTFRPNDNATRAAAAKIIYGVTAD